MARKEQCGASLISTDGAELETGKLHKFGKNKPAEVMDMATKDGGVSHPFNLFTDLLSIAVSRRWSLCDCSQCIALGNATCGPQQTDT